MSDFSHVNDCCLAHILFVAVVASMDPHTTSSSTNRLNLLAASAHNGLYRTAHPFPVRKWQDVFAAYAQYTSGVQVVCAL